MTSAVALLCPIVGFGLLLFIVFKLVRALTNPSRSRLKTGPVSAPLMTSMADDGFWISSDQLSPSTMLRYLYWVHGVQRIGEVPFQPGPDGRQFIYTGERPDSISVVLAAAAMESALEEDLPPPPPITTVLPPRRSTSTRSHFPRAY